MRLHDINESINDKGIFKAIFLAGMPGAGKSTVSKRITDGTVEPRMVNTDRSYEFLLAKNPDATPETAWALLGSKSRTISTDLLANYLNGMLPLFVDGTSANPSSALRRAGIVESLGYDTAMVWVDVSYETALKRIGERELTNDRKVDRDFVKRVYEDLAGNKELYKSRFGGNFIEVDNNGNTFDQMENKVYNITNQFFTAPVKNPIGQRLLKEMEESGDKYLVPNIYSMDYIKKVVSVWYTK